MSESLNFDADGRRIIETPCLSLESSIGKIALTWINCRMRLFQNDIYDHVEFTPSEGDLRAFKPTQEVMDFLHEHNYPSSFDPIEDQATVTWFVKTQESELENELEAFFNQE